MIEAEIQEMIRIQDETLFHLDKIKNGQSVHIGANQVLTRLFTGQKIFVDARDASVSPALMMDGRWKPETTAVLTRLLRPSDTFVDVGASMGYFGIVAGTVIEESDGGSIHMIEANPRLVPLIFKSINVTGLLGMAAVSNFAISDEAGEVQLQVVKDLMGSSSLLDLDSQFRATAPGTATVGLEVEEMITVPAITLDGYAELESLARVDVVKIDIEGHEERAYAGMTRIIDENRADLRLMMAYERGRYSDPVRFLGQVKDDFKYVYGIDQSGDRRSGELIEIGSFDELALLAGDGSTMVVAANREVDC